MSRYSDIADHILGSEMTADRSRFLVRWHDAKDACSALRGLEAERDRLREAIANHITDLCSTANVLASDAITREAFSSTITEIRKAADELRTALEQSHD